MPLVFWLSLPLPVDAASTDSLLQAATRDMHVYGLLHTEQYHNWCVDAARTDSLLQAATRGMHVYGLLHKE